ncbi:MAG: OB-fold domain-containing protein [Candidatus Binatia bacterium]
MAQPTAMLPRPLPQPNLDTEPWWAGLRRHELLVQECAQCRTLTFPPQPMCPACRSLERGWRKSSGTGRIYSWVVVRRPSHPYFADKVPYAVVLVEMAEGFRVVGAIDCPLDGLREGLPVEAHFEDVSDDLSLLRFRVVP